MPRVSATVALQSVARTTDSHDRKMSTITPRVTTTRTQRKATGWRTATVAFAVAGRTSPRSEAPLCFILRDQSPMLRIRHRIDVSVLRCDYDWAEGTPRTMRPLRACVVLRARLCR